MPAGLIPTATILVVDDDKELLLTVEEVLRRVARLAVLTAMTVADAERLILAQARIDLGIVDLNLRSGGQSDELCELLSLRKVPYLRMTDDPKRINPRFRGAGCIVKPLERSRLVQSVSQVLREVP